MVQVKLTNNNLSVYIDRSLHLYLADFCSLQSWVDDDRYPYFIEWYSTSIAPVLTQYGRKSLWLDILKKTDKLIHK